MKHVPVQVSGLSKKFQMIRSQPTILKTLRSLGHTVSFTKELWVLKNVSFEIHQGENWAVIGKNGSGKTTLFRILANIYKATSGAVEIHGDVNVMLGSCVGFNGDLNVEDNIYLFGTLHGLCRKGLKKDIEAILNMAEVAHLRYEPLKELSYGQQQRIALTVFFRTAGDILIFDEGFDGVDQSFQVKCKNYFREITCSDKTVMIASHNLDFLQAYCQKALWLDDGQIRMIGEAREIIAEYKKENR